MRPMPGDDAMTGRSRTTSFTDNAQTPLPGAHQAPQMTYFLADEKTVDAARSQASSNRARPRDKLKGSNFGIQSLETTISSLATGDSDEDVGPTRTQDTWKKRLNRSIEKSTENLLQSQPNSSNSSADVSRDLSPSEPRPRTTTKAKFSQPLTPMILDSPALGSTPSSPASRRNSMTDSFTDDGASQAIVSSGDDEMPTASGEMDASSASQLVMPSIKMPSRRPFTEKGKNMGRLKIMIAGDSGKLCPLVCSWVTTLMYDRYRENIPYQSNRTDM